MKKEAKRQQKKSYSENIKIQNEEDDQEKLNFNEVKKNIKKMDEIDIKKPNFSLSNIRK